MLFIKDNLQRDVLIMVRIPFLKLVNIALYMVYIVYVISALITMCNNRKRPWKKRMQTIQIVKFVNRKVSVQETLIF